MPQVVVLYHFVGCPYSDKVRNFLSRHGITVTQKDIHQYPAYREELIRVGGKPQVPCLVIDGQALYESEDIIRWFQKKWRYDEKFSG